MTTMKSTDSAMIETSEQRNPVEVLAEEFLERRRCGESVDIREYVVGYPEFSNEIKRLFPAMLAMEHVRTSRLSSSGIALDVQIDALDQLGDFRIIGELGRGGMGVVYEAEQKSLRRRVAVKVLPQRVLSSSRRLKRFQIEAQTAAGLHHTNIVPVFGVGEQDGECGALPHAAHLAPVARAGQWASATTRDAPSSGHAGVCVR